MANALSGKPRSRVGNALLDFTRGSLMGVTTDALGYPVDLMTTALRPLGYNVENPIGGSNWLASKLTTPTNSLAETAGRTLTGMLTPGPEDLLRMAGVLGPKRVMNELITYHGSPHRINNVDEANPVGKFDLSKIGTGEGAQAYGHGVYLAEHPGTARTYMTAGGTPAQGTARHYLKMYNNDPETAIAVLEGGKRSTTPESNKMVDEAIRLLREGKVDSGHFYTVDLPDEHIAKMLDWDAPLSEQPEAVRKALAGAIEQNFKISTRPLGQDSVDLLLDGMTVGAFPAGKVPTGSEIVSALPLHGKGLYEMLASKLMQKGSSKYRGVADKAASEYLRSLGIPGIKYFDGGSRAAGEGTRNFVIFDPDIAKILKRE